MDINVIFSIHAELLERVLFRLGSVDTDQQFESAVNKFLVPVLMKITSTNESVRCKVSDILANITCTFDKIFVFFSVGDGGVNSSQQEIKIASCYTDTCRRTTETIRNY